MACEQTRIINFVLKNVTRRLSPKKENNYKKYSIVLTKFMQYNLRFLPCVGGYSVVCEVVATNFSVNNFLGSRFKVFSPSFSYAYYHRFLLSPECQFFVQPSIQEFAFLKLRLKSHVCAVQAS